MRISYQPPSGFPCIARSRGRARQVRDTLASFVPSVVVAVPSEVHAGTIRAYMNGWENPVRLPLDVSIASLPRPIREPLQARESPPVRRIPGSSTPL